uniref:Uncharacterized protein n=2 Tax=Anguilla anguilla TaxID=7936 RepID=A0A0E9SBS9_ANGAN
MNNGERLFHLCLQRKQFKLNVMQINDGKRCPQLFTGHFLSRK